MITFLSTASHAYTHQVVADAMPGFRRLGYVQALSARSLPRGTYIFSDLDRLGFWQLELAARLYRTLEAGGCRVLNDPARFLPRLPLLKALKRNGFNDFSAWEAAEADLVDRFPVFIRTRAAHRGVLSDLLDDRDALVAAIEGAITRGFPINDLMIVEYCSEPLRPGLYRKHSVYRIGERYIGSTSVHDSGWMAKEGQLGIADQALYDEEHRDVVENPHASIVAPAFEMAGVEYGRVDFGFVGGRAQIYEINTNPSITSPQDHPFPIRMDSGRVMFANRLEALRALDTAGEGPLVEIPPPPELSAQQRRYRLFPGYQWMP